MDEETEMLLGMAIDDELAAIDDELAGAHEEYEYEDDIGHEEYAMLGDGQMSEEELGWRFPKFAKKALRVATRYHPGLALARGGIRAIRPRRRPSPRISALVARRDLVQAKKRAFVNKLVPSVPGVPAVGARNFPLGFGAVTFVNAGLTQFNLVANPQRPFKGARLVIDVRRSAGALAELVTVTTLNIGQNNQLVSSAALPAEAFRPDGFDTVLSLDPATPGIDITLGIAISAAPGVGETVAVSAMLIGNTIG